MSEVPTQPTANLDRAKKSMRFLQHLVSFFTKSTSLQKSSNLVVDSNGLRRRVLHRLTLLSAALATMVALLVVPVWTVAAYADPPLPAVTSHLQ